VITAGEILRDEELQMDIDVRDRWPIRRSEPRFLARTRQLLQRDENVTNVFQARPLVKDLAEAKSKIDRLNLSKTSRRFAGHPPGDFQYAAHREYYG